MGQRLAVGPDRSEVRSNHPGARPKPSPMTCALRPTLLAATAATALVLLLPWAAEARPGFGAGGAGGVGRAGGFGRAGSGAGALPGAGLGAAGAGVTPRAGVGAGGIGTPASGAGALPGAGWGTAGVGRPAAGAYGAGVWHGGWATGGYWATRPWPYGWYGTAPLAWELPGLAPPLGPGSARAESVAPPVPA